MINNNVMETIIFNAGLHIKCAKCYFGKHICLINLDLLQMFVLRSSQNCCCAYLRGTFQQKRYCSFNKASKAILRLTFMCVSGKHISVHLA